MLQICTSVSSPGLSSSIKNLNQMELSNVADLHVGHLSGAQLLNPELYQMELSNVANLHVGHLSRTQLLNPELNQMELSVMLQICINRMRIQIRINV